MGTFGHLTFGLVLSLPLTLFSALLSSPHLLSPLTWNWMEISSGGGRVSPLFSVSHSLIIDMEEDGDNFWSGRIQGGWSFLPPFLPPASCFSLSSQQL